jgi:hypothetical protein
MLAISAAYLNDAADVSLALGASLGLNFSGVDNIGSLFVNGSSEPAGTYGGTGSGADFELAAVSGTGLLRVIHLLGDYNDNGTVDAADYTVWRNRLGGASSLPNDNTAGVGPDDYARWKTNYGQTVGNGLLLFISSIVINASAERVSTGFVAEPVGNKLAPTMKRLG